MEDVSPLTGSNQGNVLLTVQNNGTHSFSFKISDIAVAILILGIGAAVGYATYKLSGRIDAASGVGTGFPLLAGGFYITFRACTKKRDKEETQNEIQQQVASLPLSLPIDDVKSSSILYHTLIENQPEATEFHVPITIQIIKDHKLGPKYEITAYGKTLYLSDVFVSEEGSLDNLNPQKYYLSAIAYIPSAKDPSQYRLRLFDYYSTAGIWYAAICTDQSGKFESKVPEADRILPLEISLALEAIAANKAPITLQGGVPERCSFSYGKCFRLSIPGFITRGSFQKLYNQIIKNNNIFSNYIDISGLVVEEPNLGPDFSSAVFYPLRGPYFKKGFYVVVPSVEKDYSYVFLLTRAVLLDEEKGTLIYQEKDAHPALAFVQYTGKDQSLTDFGTLAHVIETNGAAIPVVDNHASVPWKCRVNLHGMIDSQGNPYTIPQNSLSYLPYYPTWNEHREKLPILKDFMRAFKALTFNK